VACNTLWIWDAPAAGRRVEALDAAPVGDPLAVRRPARETADNRFAHDRIDQLSEQLQQANARADIVGRRNQAAEDLLEISYPALMEDRLDAKNIGVLFAGTRFFDFAPFTWFDSSERAYLRLAVIGLAIIGLVVFRPQGILGRPEVKRV
jgi:hypothetical protein